MSLADEAERALKLYVPRILDLTTLEFANALRNNVRWGGLPADVARRHLEIFRRSFVESSSAAYVDDALGLAIRFDHPVYDCVYIAFALQARCPFFTADRKLFRKFASLDDLMIFDIHDLPRDLP